MASISAVRSRVVVVTTIVVVVDVVDDDAGTVVETTLVVGNVDGAVAGVPVALHPAATTVITITRASNPLMPPP
jgi:hypothetical protein